VKGDESRKITGLMLRNKGLARKRKEEDNNPRVKLRMKLKKAINKMRT
jgi:Sas10 C-terminal domain